jgi:Bacteriophage Gp15 protein.
MFRLNQPLDDSIEFDGVTYKLSLAFDNVLDVFDHLEMYADEVGLPDYVLADLLANPEQSDSLTLQQKVDLFIKIIETYVNGDVNEQPVQYDILGNEMAPQPSQNKSLYSFKYDAEYIFASFVDAYGIDLHEEFGRLDWRKFVILFRDLPSETKIKQVIEIRQWEPDKNTAAEEIKRMEELQDIYALPDD